MGFASAWLEKRTLFPQLIKEAPDKRTGIIIVVPAFNEPGIERLLDSLAGCSEPRCGTEVIIVVNAPPGAGKNCLENNIETIRNIESWKKKNTGSFFRLFALDTGITGYADWGVGYARKTGMDEAVRRFNATGNPNGVILSLDADCTVQPDYLTAVCDQLYLRNDRQACSIRFEHPVSGTEFDPEIYRHIILYELHLRYYLQALAYSGFPHAFHTVGSSMAVKAGQYVRAGGMNRRKAGEDFYFIEKLIPAGGYFALNSTVVYPSPRPSMRVPFGTGATITKIAESGGKDFLTYNLNAFVDLGRLFSMTDRLFSCGSEDLPAIWNTLPVSLKHYIGEAEFVVKLTEISGNTSGLATFTKRFFNWFNMFRIVKYLNHSHASLFEKVPVAAAALELLQMKGLVAESKDPLGMLLVYRNMEEDFES